jgi:hypothetical protein
MKRRDLLKSVFVAPLAAAIPRTAKASFHERNVLAGRSTSRMWMYSSGVVRWSHPLELRPPHRILFVDVGGGVLRDVLDKRPLNQKSLCRGDIVTMVNRYDHWELLVFSSGGRWKDTHVCCGEDYRKLWPEWDREFRSVWDVHNKALG